MTATTGTKRDSGSGGRADIVLTVSCVDRPGIVHAVSGFLVGHDCTIVESQQFGDRDTGAFFMRVQFAALGDPPVALEVLRAQFGAVASAFGMTWQLTPANHRTRVLIMVSRFGHCLNDLLFRASTGVLDIDVVAVVSNHPDLRALAENYAVPFRHIPVSPTTKESAEAQLGELIDTLDVELVVLARYMQILTPGMCGRLAGRAINIHHSMLPSFKGARPYEQAHARGVKLVGATAHYVTADLDEGPIIEQQVARVDHGMTIEEVTASARDSECLALARAVLWHCEHRVLLNGHRTVVFAR